MNYLKVYCSLIRKAEKRTPPEGYTEKHHTFPKSIFGKNNRVVVLTAREHYVAHVLLEKICIQRYGMKDERTVKMNWAHILMIGDRCGVGKYYNSNLYECARKRHFLMFSGDNHPRRINPELWSSCIGDNHHMKKMKYRKMYSENMVGEKNPMYGKFGKENPLYGRKIPKETIEKRTNSRCKRIYFLEDSDGNKYQIKNLKQFCRENSLPISSMYNLVNGKIKLCWGWKTY